VDSDIVILLMAVVFMGLALLGVPVAVSLLGGAMIGAVLIDMPLGALVTRMYDGVNSVPLLAIPFFILAAELLNSSGVAARIIRFAQTIVGHYRSGLGQVNALFSILFAGKSGSSTADVAANSKLLLPAMKLDGYRPEQSAALIAIASTIANLIPPSILAIVYGAIGGVSISGLFIGGFGPGLFVGIALMFYTRFFVKGPKHKRATFAEFAVATRRATLPLLIPVIILGGIFTGLFTPTEAGMIAVVYGLLIVIPFLAPRHIRNLPKDFIDSAVVYATPLLAVAAASAFAWMLALLQAPQAVARYMVFAADRPRLMLLLVVLVVVFLGQFIDPVPATVILMPLIMEMTSLANIRPLHMGITVVTALTFGLVTAPYGLSLLMATSFAGVPFVKGLKEAIPMYSIFIVLLGIMIVSEDVTLFLPRFFLPDFNF
jgi:C4-dicarboxylate transporter, DctM subunit